MGARLARLKDFIWPSMGPKRYMIYLGRRAQRLRASPHAIAAGIASGAAVSVFPFIGFHFILGFVLAFFVRGNMLAAAIGTAFGNPFTFPIFFALSYQIGKTVLPGEQRAADSIMAEANVTDLVAQMFSEGFAGLWPVLQAMIIGAIPVALVTFAAFYLLTRTLVTRARRRKAERLALRRASGAAGQV